MYAGAVAAGGAAGAAASASSIKRLILGGPVALIDKDTFLNIVSKNREEVLVVHSLIKGLFSEKHVYATSYKGFVFVTKAKEPLSIVPDVEAENLWLPPSIW